MGTANQITRVRLDGGIRRDSADRDQIKLFPEVAGMSCDEPVRRMYSAGLAVARLDRVMIRIVGYRAVDLEAVSPAAQ